MTTSSRWAVEGIDLARPEVFAHWTEVALRFSDQDAVGHVNNVAYAALVESGRIAYMREGTKFQHNTIFSFAALHINFIQEMFYPGVARVGTTVVRVGARSFMIGHGIFKDNTLYATATGTLAHRGKKDGVTAEIPDDARAVLEALRAAALTASV